MILFKTLRTDVLLRMVRCKMLWVLLCWVVGLLLGTVIAARIDPSSFSLMRRTASSQVSIVDRFIAAAFPFLIAAYAVYMNRPKLLLAVCFCKAFCFSFCAFIIIASFGTAGWLVQPLLQFTDICIIPVFCWFCVRNVSGKRKSWKKDALVCLIFAAITATADYWIVAPFLAKLIDI